ncbi:hypothetical protein SAMN02745753_03009 [Marinomonas polaris DSM 16579]|uniref:pEK499-p136 HEPN domain-containing protein n=1 Tax=Marinomonas polaris DSM 16579 TaxID=1122206 RepID=A0A1M5G391_9GAMM|nr:hypothetical protein [Marinomonas polaris]SHF98198.1 hypothetical protein SAMN02745753_03009 [Marinomonas polaris DSM 16579]
MENQLDLLAFEFFKLFARYESSLKERGFFVVNRGKLIVDWDRYANQEIGNDFLNELGEERQVAEYILNSPPKKQSANEENQIIWVDVPNNEQSVQMLFAHISRIRNNLYHGAKFNGTWFDPERSSLLLSNALTILKFYQNRLGI